MAPARRRRGRQGPDMLATAIYRTQFYRRRFHLLVGLVTVLTAALGGALWMVASFALTPTAPRYFAIRMNDRPTELRSLGRPVLEDRAVIAWAEARARRLSTVNVVNYRTEFAELRGDFTDEGWQNWETALEASRLVRTLRVNRMMISGKPRGAGRITDQGRMPGGVYAWRVEVPLRVDQRGVSARPGGGNFRRILDWNILFTIIRVPATQTPDGLAIQQIVIDDEVGEG